MPSPPCSSSGFPTSFTGGSTFVLRPPKSVTGGVRDVCVVDFYFVLNAIIIGCYAKVICCEGNSDDDNDIANDFDNDNENCYCNALCYGVN